RDTQIKQREGALGVGDVDGLKVPVQHQHGALGHRSRPPLLVSDAAKSLPGWARDRAARGGPAAARATAAAVSSTSSSAMVRTSSTTRPPAMRATTGGWPPASASDSASASR